VQVLRARAASGRTSSTRRRRASGAWTTGRTGCRRARATRSASESPATGARVTGRFLELKSAGSCGQRGSYLNVERLMLTVHFHRQKTRLAFQYGHVVDVHDLCGSCARNSSSSNCVGSTIHEYRSEMQLPLNVHIGSAATIAPPPKCSAGPVRQICTQRQLTAVASPAEHLLLTRWHLGGRAPMCRASGHGVRRRSLRIGCAHARRCRLSTGPALMRKHAAHAVASTTLTVRKGRSRASINPAKAASINGCFP